MNKMGKRKAVILLSGGLDSTTTLFIAKDRDYDCSCLTFLYGQRHKKEIMSAKKIARITSSPWRLITLNIPHKGSSLIDKRLRIASDRSLADISKGIPNTYVSARNIIFLSVALSFAEGIDAEAIFIGANAIDFSGYPDCRPQFYQAFRRVIQCGTKKGLEGHAMKIFTPLIDKTKADIIRLGNRLGVPYELTWSCYEGGKKPCGRCDSCILRKKGFKEASMSDPLEAR